MKKCVKCGRTYDDSVLICNVCDLYLIKDIASEARSNNVDPTRIRDENDYSHRGEVSRNTTNHTPRRHRVIQVEEPEDVEYSSNTQPQRTIFSASDEDNIDSAFVEQSGRRNSRRRRSNRLSRRVLPVLRIIFPVILILIAICLIVINWISIREFLCACIVGGLIGGILLTFLSLRFGRYFNMDIVTVGIVGGAIVGCIIKYNLLGSMVDLSELIDTLMPCVIACVGIWMVCRSVFRR